MGKRSANPSRQDKGRLLHKEQRYTSDMTAHNGMSSGPCFPQNGKGPGVRWSWPCGRRSMPFSTWPAPAVSGRTCPRITPTTTASAIISQWRDWQRINPGDGSRGVMQAATGNSNRLRKRNGGDGGESNSPSRRAYKPDVLQACPPVRFGLFRHRRRNLERPSR